MKKFAAILSLVLCLAFFAACGEIEENTKPVISGFADTYTVKAGEEFDALQGVSAFDKEDGDLTDKIVVSSMPEVEFRGGKAVFSQEGSYDIIYSVTDSGKLKTEEFAALTVTAADAVETLYHTFDFSKSSAEIGRGGWACGSGCGDRKSAGRAVIRRRDCGRRGCGRGHFAKDRFRSGGRRVVRR